MYERRLSRYRPLARKAASPRLNAATSASVQVFRLNITWIGTEPRSSGHSAIGTGSPAAEVKWIPTSRSHRMPSTTR